MRPVNLFLDSLLQLQNRDSEVIALRQQLAATPAHRQALQAKITAASDAFKTSQQDYQNKQLRHREIDQQLKTFESTIARFKNQQLIVKKNEEYAALEHQIAQTQAENAAFEEEGIALLIELDGLQVEFKKIEAQHRATLKIYQEELLKIDAQEAQARTKLTAAEEAYEAACTPLPPEVRKPYENVKRRGIRLPFIVEMIDHRCQGCHLKVSQEIESEILKKESLVPCEQCGRLLYQGTPAI